MCVKLSLDSALVTLEQSPICTSLLKEIWPSIEQHNFSQNQTLEVPMPVHEVKCGSETKILPYSHSVIRKTLGALGMIPVGLHANKKSIKIRLRKCPN